MFFVECFGAFRRIGAGEGTLRPSLGDLEPSGSGGRAVISSSKADDSILGAKCRRCVDSPGNRDLVWPVA
eukprot:6700739-Pyramimonas_sp.AAC.1